MIRILRQVWPTIVIQRCLVHIQRQGLSWCRQSPKRPDARQLRALFRHVMAIHTVAERDRFVAQVQAWESPIRAAPGTPGRTRAGFQRSQTCPQYVTRRLAEHVSLSRRSSDPKIHQRPRGIFRPTQTQVSATPRARPAPSECVFAVVYLSLPTIKNQHFLAFIPILSEAKNLSLDERSLAPGRR